MEPTDSWYRQVSQPIPCPFCPSAMTPPFVSKRYAGWLVECGSCGAHKNLAQPTTAEAIADWNRRAPVSGEPTLPSDLVHAVTLAGSIVVRLLRDEQFGIVYQIQSYESGYVPKDDQFRALRATTPSLGGAREQVERKIVEAAMRWHTVPIDDDIEGVAAAMDVNNACAELLALTRGAPK